MTWAACHRRAVIVLVAGLIGCHRAADTRVPSANEELSGASTSVHFRGSKPGDNREVAGIKLCWCPPGKFTMGSLHSEPDRRPDEDQVDVTLTKGFWMAKFETTQGQWKRIVGKLPGAVTAELPEDDSLPVGNVNFAQAEEFCRMYTELAQQAKELPEEWEIRLPTEAQWEFRAGRSARCSRSRS